MDKSHYTQLLEALLRWLTSIYLKFISSRIYIFVITPYHWFEDHNRIEFRLEAFQSFLFIYLFIFFGSFPMPPVMMMNGLPPVNDIVDCLNLSFFSFSFLLCTLFNLWIVYNWIFGLILSSSSSKYVHQEFRLLPIDDVLLHLQIHTFSPFLKYFSFNLIRFTTSLHHHHHGLIELDFCCCCSWTRSNSVFLYL